MLKVYGVIAAILFVISADLVISRDARDREEYYRHRDACLNHCAPYDFLFDSGNLAYARDLNHEYPPRCLCDKTKVAPQGKD